jgi:ABC-2 type transport system ATP-binding protein
MSIIYTTHYMEEAERLCDRIAIVDHGHIIVQGTREELIRNAFATRSEVVMRVAGEQEAVAAWVVQRKGVRVGEAVQFTVEHPAEITGLLDTVAKAGLELVDVALRKPNLESVFLKLTGRELRD